MSEKDFVTVVSVEDAPFVTVVEVEEPFTAIVGTEETSSEPPVEEEIQLYKLPGERLGFGLKFDGGPTVYGLTIESTAEGSPSARARASWGPLGPGDCILAVDGRPVAGMTRQEVVGHLTESGMVVTLLVRRGPPPVPPRRQARRRLPGPPPPPRPFPRAPPRLVDFLPKDNATRAIDPLPEDSSMLKCSISENTHNIEINGGSGFAYKQENKECLEMNFQDCVKDKIVPLKTLNPKLISLFEHSQPSDTNNKTSQINNNLWKNVDKCQKSVKDKIAIFSCESNNNFENRIKHKDNNDLIQINESIQTAPKKFQTLHSISAENSVSDKRLLPSKVNIRNTNEGNDANINSKKSIIKIETTLKNNPLIDHKLSTALTEDALPTSPSTQPTNRNDVSLSELNKKSTNPEQVSLKTETSKYNLLKSISDNRKKSLKINEKNSTKLRGLVIPENISRISSADQILDLPEIKNNNLFPGLIKNLHDVEGTYSCDINHVSSNKFKPLSPNLNITRTPSFQWKTQIDQDIPKYSPAFKRKTLSVFGTRAQFADSHPSLCSEDNNDKDSSVHKSVMTDIPDTLKCEVTCFDSPDESSKTLPSSFSPGKDEISLGSLSMGLDETDPQNNRGDVDAPNHEEETDLINEINILRPFNTVGEIHSRSSSIASETEVSHSSDYSSAGLRKIKEPLETKMDSLPSQDMSDSGNHSIPSNYSKSKNNSSDGSLCSLVNGENQDSDDTSVNYSSDEGHFIEFNFKTTETPICRNTNEPVSLDSKEDALITTTDSSTKEYSAKNMKNDETLNNSKCHSPVESIEETTTKNTLKNDASNISEKVNPLKIIESQKEHSVISYRVNDDRKILDEVSLFKINHFNKIRSAEIKNNNDYGTSYLTRDHNEDMRTLNSPTSDLQKENHFASITSLASSTSLISQQELCQLIEESNDSSIDDNNGSPEISVIVLHRDTAEGSIGITLAGGIDYESKDITVHKVLHGSSADRDGRIKKGHRILSINGKSMKGLTHAESMAVLKAPRHEVVLVVARTQGEFLEENNNISQSPLLQSSDTDSLTLFANPKEGEVKWGPALTITLKKEGAGLGFSLKGGKDSPNGDQPITVQKIFTGGCADKSGHIFAGDEILNINDYDLTSMTRVEAWTLMKRLPDGEVLLKIRHPVECLN